MPVLPPYTLPACRGYGLPTTLLHCTRFAFTGCVTVAHCAYTVCAFATVLAVLTVRYMPHTYLWFFATYVTGLPRSRCYARSTVRFCYLPCGSLRLSSLLRVTYAYPCRFRYARLPFCYIRLFTRLRLYHWLRFARTLTTRGSPRCRVCACGSAVRLPFACRLLPGYTFTCLPTVRQFVVWFCRRFSWFARLRLRG